MKPLICCLLLSTGVFAQLPSSFTPTLSSTAEASRVAPSDAKATTLLMQANLALTGGQAPSDGIFTGTVALPDGEKVANGSVTLKLKGSGFVRAEKEVLQTLWRRGGIRTPDTAFDRITV